uniref:RRM domain-containing protein n=1 Tax=Arundo donax TaxID=35708 RepID=A0A0A9DHY2_ARUDO
MTADKLVNLFMPFGQIDRVVMNLDHSLVWYADVHSIPKAIKHMDGYFVEGKKLVVKGSERCPTNAADHTFSQPSTKPTKEIDMSNLFVGSVPSAVTADHLVELFHPFGEIVQVRKFHFQGYGIVRYAIPSSAAAAIDHMDGYQIGGSSLVVRVLGLPRESDAARNASTVQMAAGNGQRQIDMTNIYVCHLPLYVTTEKLIELFLPCGQITQAKVVADKFTGVSKGFGFVRFADAYASAVAITHMNGYPFEGHVLEVRIAGVPPSDMSSYMAHFYSHFSLPDPSRMAVGVPTSYWPYYYAESAYATPSAYQGQGTESAPAAADQTSQQEGLPGTKSVSSVAEKDCFSASNPVTSEVSQGWAGPPGFEPHAVNKKGATVMGPSQACSQSAGWVGPPGFEPNAVAKKDTAARNPSQAC